MLAVALLVAVVGVAAEFVVVEEVDFAVGPIFLVVVAAAGTTLAAYETFDSMIFPSSFDSWASCSMLSWEYFQNYSCCDHSKPDWKANSDHYHYR